MSSDCKKSDEEKIKAILAGGSGREKILRCFLRNRPFRRRIQKMVRQGGGVNADAEDLLVDSIVHLDAKIRKGGFQLRAGASLESYLFGICRNKWRNLRRKRSREKLSGLSTQPAGGPSADFPREDLSTNLNPELLLKCKEYKQLLEKLISELGSRCRETLRLWMEHYSMQEIAEKMQKSSAMMAKKDKFRCLRRLITDLDNKPALKEELLAAKRFLEEHKHDCI